jgi:hypothetical protein
MKKEEKFLSKITINAINLSKRIDLAEIAIEKMYKNLHKLVAKIPHTEINEYARISQKK